MDMNECSSHDRNRDLTDTSDSVRDEENVKVKFETLRAMEQGETIDIDSHMSDRVSLLMFVREICLPLFMLLY
jgi:hypothetical protein